eukprot:CAMPEP_0119465176 /NCGR_PEP_ID=MMETSP1344-20130328/426_1 /TAXON_ID=236787 /ORGANISM="Florenciella parvula, Strain CCMP2471" /LENGTH=63 /DNA_ID=CAMNT_0007497421 /DNA_START=115 /DNA_END=306 /DNA_ORIENTATION=-
MASRAVFFGEFRLHTAAATASFISCVTQGISSGVWPRSFTASTLAPCFSISASAIGMRPPSQA